MGIEFTIDEKVGPLMEPMRSWDDIEKVGSVVLTMSNDGVSLVNALW
jgi:hypothetical protein